MSDCYGRNYGKLPSCKDCKESAYCKEAKDIPAMTTNEPIEDAWEDVGNMTQPRICGECGGDLDANCNPVKKQSEYDIIRVMNFFKQMADTPQILQIIAWTMRGDTYQETADKLHISKQAVHKLLLHAINERCPDCHKVFFPKIDPSKHRKPKPTGIYKYIKDSYNLISKLKRAR